MSETDRQSAIVTPGAGSPATANHANPGSSELEDVVDAERERARISERERARKKVLRSERARARRQDAKRHR
jgi:hypothetical protein